jgi:alcohol dehydrogenase YqhD (iron-dependent ADH family)
MVHGWVLLICCFIPQVVILYGSGSIKKHPLLDQLVSQST